MDTGLLILRIVVGLLLVGHGSQKLFGWFGGYGLSGTGAYLESLGYRPGRPFAALSGLAEAGAGVLLVLGLGAPLAAATIVANFINAYRGHAGNGIWNDNGGWELPLLYGAIGGALGFVGFGAYALDDQFGWDIAGTECGAIALAAGVAAGLIAQVTARRSPVSQPDAAQAA